MMAVATPINATESMLMMNDVEINTSFNDNQKGKGSWTKEEHERFLKGMQLYPKGPWKAITAIVGTRTVRQTQTHAQKYREKLTRRMRGLRNRNGTLRSNVKFSAEDSVPIPLSFQATTPSTRPVNMMTPTSSPSSRNSTFFFGEDMKMQPVSSNPQTTSSPASVSSALTFESEMLPVTIDSSTLLFQDENSMKVPDFNESMDFFMEIYYSDPMNLGNFGHQQQPQVAVMTTVSLQT